MALKGHCVVQWKITLSREFLTFVRLIIIHDPVHGDPVHGVLNELPLYFMLVLVSWLVGLDLWLFHSLLAELLYHCYPYLHCQAVKRRAMINRFFQG